MEEFPSGQRGQTVNLLRELRWFESTLLHQKRPANRRGVFLSYKPNICSCLYKIPQRLTFVKWKKGVLYRAER